MSNFFGKRVLLSIITLCGAFVVASKQWDDAGIYFDSGNNSPLLQQFGEWGAIVRLLIQGFVEQDDSRDVVANGGACTEEELPKKIFLIKLQYEKSFDKVIQMITSKIS